MIEDHKSVQPCISYGLPAVRIEWAGVSIILTADRADEMAVQMIRAAKTAKSEVASRPTKVSG